MFEKETDFMKDAYGMLYEIQVKLNKMIIANLTRAYGTTWLLKNYESKPSLQTLLSYFRRYHDKLPHFTRDQIQQLYQLTDIRNKIAHTELISDIEFKQLKKCHSLVKRQPITKRIKMFAN